MLFLWAIHKNIVEGKKQSSLTTFCILSIYFHEVEFFFIYHKQPEKSSILNSNS